MQAGAGVWGESVSMYLRPKWKILWSRAPTPADVLAPWPWWNIMPWQSPTGMNGRSIFTCRELFSCFFVMTLYVKAR